MTEYDVIETAILESTKPYPRFWKIRCREKGFAWLSIIAQLRASEEHYVADVAKRKLGVMLRTWQQKQWPTILKDLDQLPDESLDEYVERCYRRSGFVEFRTIWKV